MALDLKSYIIGKQNGYSGDITLKTLTVAENGTTNAPSGEAYNKVIANVQPPLEEKSVTENGEVTPSAGKYGLSKVTVAVPLPSGTVQINENGTANVKDYEYAKVDVQPDLETKSITVTENGSQTVTPTSGKDGMSSVVIATNVQPDLEAGTGSVTTNGTHTFTPSEGKDGFSGFTAAVNVQPTLQSKSVSITANGSETVTADEGYDGLSEVEIMTNVTPSLQNKTVTQNGTVTADEGYDGLGEVDVNVPSDPWQKLNELLNGTLVKFRTTIDFNLDGLLLGYSKFPGLAQTLKYVELPNSTSKIPVWGYSSLTNLIRADIGNVYRIDNVSFYDDNNIEQFIMRKNDTHVTLHSSGSLPLTAKLKIYVPENLIDTYPDQPNWASYETCFRKLYIAETIQEKEAMLIDDTISSGSMIVCDVDESYTVKE